MIDEMKQELRFHLTMVSENKKTGPIPVSTSSKATCPEACPLKGAGCYAESGPMLIHWKAVTQAKRGDDFKEFCDKIASLPPGQLWRHNQAGDLVPNKDDPTMIDRDKLARLTGANLGRKGFTYTHYNPEGENRAAIQWANSQGFTVNVSALSIDHAVEIRKQGIPAVCVVPEDHPKLSMHNGVPILVCPVQTGDRKDCASCQMCQDPNRTAVIAFQVHGSQKSKVVF